ncbi:unnamed protein product, partial [Iphiclides podalirius]
MKNTCCVPDCDSKRSSVKLHRFPKTEIRLKWVELVNCTSLKKLGVDELQKSFVCHKHFEQRFVTGSLRLRHSAYPTLLSNNEIQSGIPAVEYETFDNQSVRDHDYTEQRKRRHEEHTYCKTQTSKSLGQKLQPCVKQNCCKLHSKLFLPCRRKRSEQNVTKTLQN